MHRPEYLLRLPRNYGFISRLPDFFEILVKKKQNTTGDGSWYLCVVKGHELNILSRVELQEEQTYTIHKKDHMTLELQEKPTGGKSPVAGEDGIDFFG